MLLGAVLASSPAVLHASPAPRAMVVSFAAVVMPSDTVKDHGHSGHSTTPAPRRKGLRPRSTTPAATPRGGGTIDPRLLPDQPWETEFYVENDLPLPSRSQLALFPQHR